MPDIKNVIELLCKHLNLSIKVAIQPEYFRLSKYNNTTQKSDTLWTMLHILSFYAAKEKQNDIYFEEYDKLSATKLYFAFLQYPEIEFYGLSESCHNNRVLLLAFAWLLATQNVLSIVVRVNLTSSLLGRECSCPNISLSDLRAIGVMLDIHLKWMEKEHLFYDWMITVIKEYEKSVDININRISWDEIGSFISLLEQIIKKKLYSVCSEKTEDRLECYNTFQCTSRLLRTSDVKCEVNKWLMDVTIQLNQVKETLAKNKEELALQLKNILMIVPLCIQV
ncbi:uncharacterized protein LOC124951612 isoform X5 [Vespa velutina]|uniref:uncharacterized protein LOC124951612 isoform X5 n=1 Tax=Vespa velutina TaxID=202808 RepID=UPI001FB1B629|nr:uncharacterized protein LOC124951612 isoform X5 [Vespa velutina]